jgi:hypothetical protein
MGLNWSVLQSVYKDAVCATVIESEYAVRKAHLPVPAGSGPTRISKSPVGAGIMSDDGAGTQGRAAFMPPCRRDPEASTGPAIKLRRIDVPLPYLPAP